MEIRVIMVESGVSEWMVLASGCVLGLLVAVGCERAPGTAERPMSRDTAWVLKERGYAIYDTSSAERLRRARRLFDRVRSRFQPSSAADSVLRGAAHLGAAYAGYHLGEDAAGPWLAAARYLRADDDRDAAWTLKQAASKMSRDQLLGTEIELLQQADSLAGRAGADSLRGAIREDLAGAVLACLAAPHCRVEAEAAWESPVPSGPHLIGLVIAATLGVWMGQGLCPQ